MDLHNLSLDFSFNYTPSNHETGIIDFFARLQDQPQHWLGEAAQNHTDEDEQSTDLVLCFSNNSGEDALAKALHATGKTGRAGSHFNAHIVQNVSKEQGITTFSAYTEKIRERHSVNDVFSFRVNWPQLCFLLKVGIIPHVLKNPKFLFVYRHDLLGQAIDYAMSLQKNNQEAPRTSLHQRILKARIASAAEENAGFETLFAYTGCDVHRVCYEDFIQNQQASVANIMDWLALEPKPSARSRQQQNPPTKNLSNHAGLKTQFRSGYNIAKGDLIDFAYKKQNLHVQELSDILQCVITGLPHSGTSALLDVFRNVPNLYTGFECGLLLNPKPRDFLSAHGRHHDIYYRNLRVSWSLTDSKMSYICQSDTWKEAYAKLRALSPEVKDKGAKLIDKTPHYFLYLDEVLARLEPVKMVVLLKDARLQYWSYKKRNNQAAAEHLFASLTPEFAKRLQDYHEAGKIYLLQYEKMCLEPETEIKKVFDYVGVDYQSSYLNFQEKFNNVLGGGIIANQVLSYKHHLSDADLAWIQNQVQHPLFYYDVTDDHVPEPDQTIVHIDAPKAFPHSDRVEIAGWIVSDLPIQGVWTLSIGLDKLMFAAQDRPDVRAAHPNFAYCQGFRQVVPSEVLLDKRLTLYYELSSGEFNYFHPLEPS